MILLITDFGLPYTAQMLAAIHKVSPSEKALVLFDDLPSFDPKAAGQLIEAYCEDFPGDSIFCCVVDPGVGSERQPLVIRAKERWFIGPDNGLFACLLKEDKNAAAWTINWRPGKLSSSFHGRDLFAPFAAKLAISGEALLENLAAPCEKKDLCGKDWPRCEMSIVYIDGFGNAMTGLKAAELHKDAKVLATGHVLSYARTFSDLPQGTLFWYENANGLVEIAENCGNAAERLHLQVGSPIAVEKVTDQPIDE